MGRCLFMICTMRTKQHRAFFRRGGDELISGAMRGPQARA
jgi:hypothetical protein